MAKRLFGLWTVCLFLSAGGAAGSEAPFIGTRGYISPQTDSLLGLEMNLAFGGDVFSFVPELVGQFEIGGFALGADMGFALAFPEDDDTSFGLGDLAIFGKGTTCRGGKGLTMCIGGQLELAFAPWGADADSAVGLQMGMLTHGRLASRFGSDLMTITPSIAMSAVVQWLFFQVHLGPEFMIPFGGDREAEISLVWGFALGVTPADLFSAALGLRGMSALTQDPTYTWNYLDLIFQFPMRAFTPVVAFSFPLDSGVQQAIDAIITVGAIARF